jgi:hypothetical protein
MANKIRLRAARLKATKRKNIFVVEDHPDFYATKSNLLKFFVISEDLAHYHAAQIINGSKSFYVR